MASPFIQAHYGWSFINHFLNNMRKAGVINCLKKYKEIQEFKFGELVGVDKFGNRYYEDKNESLCMYSHLFYFLPVIKLLTLVLPSCGMASFFSVLSCFLRFGFFSFVSLFPWFS
eukprot:Phypoly_transcript_06520.p1 GENE.Phypoly_transcript_06520~~Phypoly_transcript_06520.p1  ORF type:complete len:124 (+),score=7.75 Phypoly_transcript_06520:28-372(+)